MSNLNFINIEYILLRVYSLFAGIDAGEVSSQTVLIIERIAWAGIAVSLVLLIAIVYFKVRLGSIERAGWHRRKEEEVIISQKNTIQSALNPRWQQVLQMVSTPSPQGESDWRRAILEADTLLADLLVERGLKGEDVGEKLRNANPLQFTTLDLAWSAHKVRNTIAHIGEGYPLTEREARATIDLYRRVFEEFNYI